MFVLILVLVLHLRITAAFVGPFDLILYDAGLCEDEGSGDMRVNITLHDFRKNFVRASADVIFKYALDDKILLHLAAYTLEGDSWTYKMAQTFGGICTSARRFLGQTAERIFKLLRAPGEEGKASKDCPAPGHYFVNNVSMPIKLEGYPLPSYSKFKLEIAMKKASNFRKIGCFYALLNFLPKQKKKSG